MQNENSNCRYCQTELPAEAAFCSLCGQPHGAILCHTCDAENISEAIFCQDCGNFLGEDESTPEDDLQSELEAKRSRLDLAEEQNALNKRELELDTAEQRAQKRAKAQQQLDAAELEANAAHIQSQAEQERQLRAALSATKRNNELRQQQDGIQRRQEDEAAEREHRQTMEKWERKKAELAKEMAFKREWLDNAQEFNAAQRAGKHRRLEEEHVQQLDHARRQLGVDIEFAQLETDARIAREKLEIEHALEMKQAEARFHRTENNLDRQDDLTHRERELELDQQQEDRELERSLASYERLQAAKDRKRDAQAERELMQKRGAQQVETEAERARREMELDRLAALNTLSPEALIAASPESQAKLLAELSMTKAFEGLSEEQILARAAEKSPAAAQALAEKYKSAGSEQSKKELVDLYAQMFSVQQTQAASHLEAMQNLVAASNQSQGERPAAPVASHAAPTLSPQRSGANCNQCGAARSSGAKFCTKCGTSYD